MNFTRATILKSLFAFGMLTVIGCTGTFKQDLQFNPAEPLRVAVLPFVSIDEKGQIVPEEGRLLIDTLTLVSRKQEETPAQIVRRQVLTELQKTSLDLVATALIDIDLPHHGFALKDGKLDMKRIYETKPIELCTKFLNCDAVLYGKVRKWDRSYYVAQTFNSVTIELELVSAKTGKVLYSASGDDTDSRGILKGPTGYSSLVLEPIKGLDSDIIVELSRNVVHKIVEPLDSKRRPQFLEAAPPSIFAVSHDGRNGNLGRGAPLVVVMYGSDGQNAGFSIGNSIERVPMIERAPGHYYGEYIPLPSDSFSKQPVTVYLTDKYGRTTERAIPKGDLTLAAQ